MSTDIQHAPAPGGPPSGAHHGPTFQLYMTVAVVLAVFTALSFVFNYMFRKGHISDHQAFALIMGVAVAKAVLVGMFFMHLKYDWSRLYFMIVPAFILGTMMMIVLLPDIVVAWHKNPREIPVSTSGTR
jgi:caa(3)-type oxidase subunit IV